jgi:hypothetical protein
MVREAAPNKESEEISAELRALAFDAMFDGVDADRVLFTLMSVARLRIGDALALKWMDLDFATGSILITNNPWRRSLKSLKSKASKRTFRLPSAFLGYDLTKYSISVENALVHANEIITKNIYIHISQEQASSVIEAVANKTLGESNNLLAQESQNVS